MSESQGFASLDTLLGATQIAPAKSTLSWADTPSGDNSGAKKPAWGSVQTAAAVSIKDQEMEAQKTTKPGRVSTPSDRESGVSRSAAAQGAPPRPSSYGGDRPSYGGDRPSYGGDRERSSYGGDRERSSYGGDRERSSYGGGGDRSSSGGYSGSYPSRRREEGDDFGGSRGEQRMRYNPDMPSHGGGGRGGDRGERRERVEVPFPTSAPYILYLSGLPYEGTEDEVRELLPAFWGEDLERQVKTVKVPITNGRLKHAFIEFQDADALRAALANDGREFMGRTATCLVAEPPKNDRFGGGSRSGGGGSYNRSGFGSGFGTSYNPDRPSHPSRGGGYDREEGSAPAERPRLNIAPRTVDSASSASSGDSSSKSNPFGNATASVKDIYADKPRAAPITATSPKSTATASSQGRRPADKDAAPTETRSDAARDWKSKGDFKPSSTGFRAASGASAASKPAADRRQGGRGNSRFSDDAEGDWKSTGGSGRTAPQQQGAKTQTKPAPISTTSSAAADKGNIFDNLGDE